VVARRPLALTTAVTITGQDTGGDTLTIDYGFGGSFTVPGGIQFTGSATDPNELVLTGATSFTSEVDTATGNYAGTIAFAGGLVPPQGTPNITFTNVGTVVDTATLVNFVLPWLTVPGNLTFNALAGAGSNVSVFDGLPEGGLPTGQIMNGMGLTRAAVLYFANKPTVIVNDLGGGQYFQLYNTVAPAGLTSLTLTARGQHNTFDITGTAAGTTVTVNAGAGNDTVNVGNDPLLATATLDNILGTLVVNGGGPAAGDTLRVMDENQGASTPPSYLYTLLDNTVSRTGAALIVYNNVQNLELDASNGGNTFDIVTTLPGMSITVYEGTGADTVTEPSPWSLGTVPIFSHTSR
jgi:hypothetical protein